MKRVRGTDRVAREGSYAGNGHHARSGDRARGTPGRATDRSTVDRRRHRPASYANCHRAGCERIRRVVRGLRGEPGASGSGRCRSLFCSLAYAMEKDRHLRRLATLRGDSMRITLAVASELMFSGALAGDRELLDLRDGIGRAAGRLAAGLADVVRADCTRLRLLGPSGEVPVAAERELTARRLVADDPAAAHAVVRTRKASSGDDRRPGHHRRPAAARRRDPRVARGGGPRRRSLPPGRRRAGRRLGKWPSPVVSGDFASTIISGERRASGVPP